MTDPRSAPSIRVAALPEEERQFAESFAAPLSSLDAYIGEYEHALSLFDYAQSLFCSEMKSQGTGSMPQVSKYAAWQQIAARDALMNIYHFGRARDGINEMLAPCTTLRSIVDMQLHKANKLFDAYFPSYHQMRHALAQRKLETRLPIVQSIRSI